MCLNEDVSTVFVFNPFIFAVRETVKCLDLDVNGRLYSSPAIRCSLLKMWIDLELLMFPHQNIT